MTTASAVRYPSPIKPEILAWVIEESGYAADDLADSVKVEPYDLRGWMSGQSPAPKGKVNEILRKLKRSPDIVYLDEVPEEARLSAHFRSMPIAEGDKVALTPVEVQVVRQAHYIQYAVSNMMRINEEPRVSISEQLELSSVPDLAKRGMRLREWLLSGESPPKPGLQFAEWRSLVEGKSIFVLMIDVNRPRGWEDRHDDDPSKLRGFSLPDQFAPMIVVCTDSMPAKTFTLFHELAHLGLQHDAVGVCHVPTAHDFPRERDANRVAGAALIPESILREFVNREQFDGPHQMIGPVSKHFAVSLRAAALAIENALGARGLYHRSFGSDPYRERNRQRESSGGRGFTRVELRLRKFGEGLVSTVLRYFADSAVTEVQVRRLLNLDTDEIYEVGNRVGVDLP